MTRRAGGRSLEHLVVEVGEAEAVTAGSTSLQLTHGPRVRLVDAGGQRQCVDEQREQRVVVVYSRSHQLDNQLRRWWMCIGLVHRDLLH